MLWALLIAVLLLGVSCCSGAASTSHNPLQALFKATSPATTTIDDSILFFEPFNAIDGEDDVTTGLQDGGSESKTLSPSLSPTPRAAGNDNDDDDEDDTAKSPSPSSSKIPSHTPSLPITGLHHAEDVNGSVAVYSGLWAFPRNILYNKVARLTETVVMEQRELLEGRAAEYHTIEQIRDPTKRALAIAKFSAKKGKKMTKKAAAVRDHKKLDRYYGEWGVRSLGVFHADEESDTSLRTGGSGDKVNSAELPTTSHSRHYVAVTRAPPASTTTTSPLRRRTLEELENIFLKSLEEDVSSPPSPHTPHITSTIPKHRILREIALSFNFKSEQIGESAYTADKALYARDMKEEKDGFRRQLRAEGGKHVSHTEEDEISRRQKSNDVLMRKKRDERRRERRSGRSNSEDERLPYDDFERNHKYCGEGHVRLIPSMKAMADSILFNADANGIAAKPLGKLFDSVGQTSVFRRSRKAGVITDRVEESIKTTFRAQYAGLPDDDETEVPTVDGLEAPPTPSDPLHALNITRLALLLGNTSSASCQGVTYPFSNADAQGFRIVRQRRPNFQLLQDTTVDGARLGPVFPAAVKGGPEEDGSAVSEAQVVEEKFSHNYPYLLRFGPKICNGRFELDMGLGRFVPFYYFPKPGPDPIASRDAKATYFDLRNRLYANATLIDVFASGKAVSSVGAQKTALPQGATLAWEPSPSARPQSIRIGSHPYTQTFAIRIVEEVVPPISALEYHPDANLQFPTSSISESFLNMEMMQQQGRQYRRLVKGDDVFALVEEKSVKYERAVRVARAMRNDGVSPFLSLPDDENPIASCNKKDRDAAVGIADVPPLPHQNDDVQQHQLLTVDTKRSEQLLGIYTSHDGWLRTPVERRKAAASSFSGGSSPSYQDGSVEYWQRAIAASKADGTALKEQHLSTRHIVEVYVDGALVADNVLEHEFPGMVNMNTRRESFTQLEEEATDAVDATDIKKDGSGSYMGPLHSHFDLQAFVHSLAHIGLDVKQNRPGSLFDNVVVGTDFDALQVLAHKAREGATSTSIPKSSREVRAAVQRKIDHEAKIGDYLSEKRHH